MLKKYLHKIIAGENLNKAEAVEAMTIIMSGEATTAQIGSFLTALKLKGEANEEIVGFVEVMRSNAKKVQHNKDVIIDTWYGWRYKRNLQRFDYGCICIGRRGISSCQTW